MNETTTVSFPGLGIEPFTLNKIAFSIGPIEVRWYGILITLGIVFAFLYATWRGKRNEGIVSDDVIDIGLFTVILGVIGARLYYVLTTLNEHDYDSFLDVIAIWQGGLAIYGGIIGGCLGILLGCKLKKRNWRRLFDMIAPGVMVAQAIGRWGNFFNGEAYGYAIEDTTRFYFLGHESVLASGEGTLFHTLRMGLTSFFGTVCYHPTFFYECVWNLLGFVLINLFYKHKKYHGQVALMYFTWYGFGRMLIEGFRTDSLYIPGTTLRISQCLGLACFLLGTALLILLATVPRLREWVARESLFVKAAPVTAEKTAACENATETNEMQDASNQEKTEEENHGNAD